MRKFIPILIVLSQWLAIAQQTDQYFGDCGKLNEKNLYIFNGTPAADEFPWIGRVYYEDSDMNILERYRFKCSAVLISKRHLLIPALCVARTRTKNLEPYAVILGADNQCYKNNSCPSPVPNYYEIDVISLHPNLTFGGRTNNIIDNNIGIIRLKSDVSYNAEVSPICLPSKEVSSAHFVGQYLHYAGYAREFIQPQKTLGLVASLESCRDLQRPVNIGDSFMCIAPDIKDRKQFIAGSPLMGVATKGFPAHPHNFYLIGLSALGVAYVNEGSINMDAVVGIGHHIEWIKYNIA